MSFYQRIVAHWSGLDRIGHAVQEPSLPAGVDACYGLRPTNHLSKGQVVVDASRALATDGLTSAQLHERAQQALQDIRALGR